MMHKTCEYFEQLISDAVDGSLDDIQQEELRAHLRECERCREFQLSVTRSSALVQRLPEFDMTADRQFARHRSAAPGSLQRIWHARISLPAPLAFAAIVVIVGLSVWIGLRRSDQPVSPISQPNAAPTINYVQVEQIAPGSGTPIGAPNK